MYPNEKSKKKGQIDYFRQLAGLKKAATDEMIFLLISESSLKYKTLISYGYPSKL